MSAEFILSLRSEIADLERKRRLALIEVESLDERIKWLDFKEGWSEGERQRALDKRIHIKKAITQTEYEVEVKRAEVEAELIKMSADDGINLNYQGYLW